MQQNEFTPVSSLFEIPTFETEQKQAAELLRQNTKQKFPSLKRFVEAYFGGIDPKLVFEKKYVFLVVDGPEGFERLDPQHFCLAPATALLDWGESSQENLLLPGWRLWKKDEPRFTPLTSIGQDAFEMSQSSGVHLACWSSPIITAHLMDSNHFDRFQPTPANTLRYLINLEKLIRLTGTDSKNERLELTEKLGMKGFWLRYISGIDYRGKSELYSDYSSTRFVRESRFDPRWENLLENNKLWGELGFDTSELPDDHLINHQPFIRMMEKYLKAQQRFKSDPIAMELLEHPLPIGFTLDTGKIEQRLLFTSYDATFTEIGVERGLVDKPSPQRQPNTIGSWTKGIPKQAVIGDQPLLLPSIDAKGIYLTQEDPRVVWIKERAAKILGSEVRVRFIPPDQTQVCTANYDPKKFGKKVFLTEDIPNYTHRGLLIPVRPVDANYIDPYLAIYQ